MSGKGLDVAVSMRRGEAPRVGMERVALIEAVDELGSISAAARRLGLSYRGAWDIVQALNNLFAAPLIEAAPGGRAGGAAKVTPQGREVAAAFRLVQAELDAALGRLQAGLAADSGQGLFWRLGMQTSARNALRGEISRIVEGSVNCEVGLRLADGVELAAVVTRRSVEALGLAPGRSAVALIKSSFVVLAKGEGLRTSARNQLVGVIVAREDGTVSSEARLDIGGGKILTATLTLESAQALDLAVGDRACALVKASHVILMTD